MVCYFKSSNWKPENIFISSFDWNELNVFYEANKEVAIAVLTEDDPLDAIPVGQRLSAFAINPDFNSLTQKNIKKIHNAGFKVYPWTVNEPEDIKKMIEIGVDAVITDYPERIRQ